MLLGATRVLQTAEFSPQVASTAILFALRRAESRLLGSSLSRGIDGRRPFNPPGNFEQDATASGSSVAERVRAPCVPPRVPYGPTLSSHRCDFCSSRLYSVTLERGFATTSIDSESAQRHWEGFQTSRIFLAT